MTVGQGVVPRKIHQPHGIAIEGSGNIYVPEWLIGGRFTGLQKI